MENIDFNFNINYMRCDNFKQKHTYILRNIIENGRLGFTLHFNSFANVSFNEDDKKLQHPIIEFIDTYNRSKTNCLCYNIIDDNYKNTFDKLFIFQYIGKTDSYFNFVMYNSETKNYSHKYCIEYDDSELCKAITRIFHLIDFKKNNDKL